MRRLRFAREARPSDRPARCLSRLTGIPKQNSSGEGSPRVEPELEPVLDIGSTYMPGPSQQAIGSPLRIRFTSSAASLYQCEPSGSRRRARSALTSCTAEYTDTEPFRSSASRAVSLSRLMSRRSPALLLRGSRARKPGHAVLSSPAGLPVHGAFRQDGLPARRSALRLAGRDLSSRSVAAPQRNGCVGDIAFPVDRRNGCSVSE